MLRQKFSFLERPPPVVARPLALPETKKRKTTNLSNKKRYSLGREPRGLDACGNIRQCTVKNSLRFKLIKKALSSECALIVRTSGIITLLPYKEITYSGKVNKVLKCKSFCMKTFLTPQEGYDAMAGLVLYVPNDNAHDNNQYAQALFSPQIIGFKHESIKGDVMVVLRPGLWDPDQAPPAH